MSLPKLAVPDLEKATGIRTLMRSNYPLVTEPWSCRLLSKIRTGPNVTIAPAEERGHGKAEVSGSNPDCGSALKNREEAPWPVGRRKASLPGRGLLSLYVVVVLTA